MPKDSFEIVSVGNELLIGKILNTNLDWLAGEITKLGGLVRRGIIVRDDVSEIAAVVRDAVERGNGWVLVTGGLGPTYDDKTLEGVAKAFNRAVEIEERALEMVKGKYSDLVEKGTARRVELTPARMKMATIPRGSEPIQNPVGTAPGVLLRARECKVICLPGVPSEMKAIFEKSVQPMIKAELGTLAVRSEATLALEEFYESALAPLLDEVLAKHPTVYVKSHPKSAEHGETSVEIHIVASAPDSMNAEREVTEVAEELTAAITSREGKVRRI